MHERAATFRDQAKDEYGFSVDIHEFPEGTKTATDAAAAIGCDVAQIASSIVFNVDDDVVVVVTSGANRVDETKLATALDRDGAAISTASPETIKETLGWSIGGVPPFCHDNPVPVLFDETLTEHDTVWAAAGTPKAVFPISPSDLLSFSGATVAAIAE